MVHPDTREKIPLGPVVSELTFKNNGDEKKPVYCILGLHGGLIKITGEDKNYYHTEIDLFRIDTAKIIKEFGDSMVFINPKGLMQRMMKELDKHKLSFKADLVKYDNYAVNNLDRIYIQGAFLLKFLLEG